MATIREEKGVATQGMSGANTNGCIFILKNPTWVIFAKIAKMTRFKGNRFIVSIWEFT